MLESVEVEELGGEFDISTCARKYPPFREGGLKPDGNGRGMSGRPGNVGYRINEENMAYLQIL
jgi:hypothetical protein